MFNTLFSAGTLLKLRPFCIISYGNMDHVSIFNKEFNNSITHHVIYHSHAFHREEHLSIFIVLLHTGKELIVMTPFGFKLKFKSCTQFIDSRTIFYEDKIDWHSQRKNYPTKIVSYFHRLLVREDTAFEAVQLLKR